MLGANKPGMAAPCGPFPHDPPLIAAPSGAPAERGGLHTLFTMVLGGLVGATPHMISAAVMALVSRGAAVCLVVADCGAGVCCWLVLPLPLPWPIIASRKRSNTLLKLRALTGWLARLPPAGAPAVRVCAGAGGAGARPAARSADAAAHQGARGHQVGAGLCQGAGVVTGKLAAAGFASVSRCSAPATPV